MSLRRPNRIDVMCVAIGITALGAAVLAARVSARPSIVPLVLLGTLSAFAANQDVTLAGTGVSASFMITMAAVVVFRSESSLLGPMLVGACGAVLIEHFRAFDWRKVLFNVGNLSLATLAAAVTFAAMPHSSSSFVPTLLVVSLPAAAANSILGTLFLTMVVAAATGRGARAVLADYAPTYLHVYPFAVLGVFMGRLYLQIGPASVLLFIVPIVIARHVFKSYIDLKEAHEATIRILIRALEAKDAYTAGHAERVARFALYIGGELRLSPMQLERLRLAALMHDVGKLIVPNHLLNKPGRLTAEEFARVREHEHVSVEILSRIDFLAPVAPSASSEHARFAWVSDKNGQPIEPHIVAVADAFDAMTSTRSYRRALTQEIAFGELRKNAARQFHPRVVEALIVAIERRGEHFGAGYEEADEHWATPPPVAGTGSAGLGDLLPEAQRVASDGGAA